MSGAGIGFVQRVRRFQFVQGPRSRNAPDSPRVRGPRKCAWSGRASED